MAKARNKQSGGRPSTLGTNVLGEMLAKQRSYFDTHITLALKWRNRAVSRLGGLVLKHEEELLDALVADLGITKYEAYLTELAPLYDEFTYVQDNLTEWTDQVQDRKAPSKFRPIKFSTYWHPKGCACIINDWRSPVLGTVLPMMYALGAGCTVMVKASDRVPHCNKVLETAFKELFVPEYVTMLTGGDDLDRALFATRFDKIYYDGSSSKLPSFPDGDLRARPSLTLMLDGNNPCFVDGTFDPAASAERIMWGKMLHAGQMRLSPSWVLCKDDIYKTFINRTFEYVRNTYGTNPIEAKDYPRMFSRAEYDQACDIIDHVGNKGEVIYGGERDPETLRIAPTVILLNSMDPAFLKRKIIGPVLPVVPFAIAEESLNSINKLGTPPAFYVFSTSKAAILYSIEYVSYGAGAICDTMIQTYDRQMPAATVGAAGCGQLGGLDGLQEFGIRKTVAESGPKRTAEWRFGPYTDSLDKLRRLYRFKQM